MKASAKDVEEDTFRSLVKVQQKVPEGLDVGRVLQQQIAHLDIGKTICILYLCVCQCMAYHTMPCHPCTGGERERERERESDRERERRDRKREREREKESESPYTVMVRRFLLLVAIIVGIFPQLRKLQLLMRWGALVVLNA